MCRSSIAAFPTVFETAHLEAIQKTGLAEGYYTVKALMLLGKKYGVELPICKAVHDILYEHAVPKDVLASLLRRTG